MKKFLGILILLSCQFIFGQNILDISSTSITVNNNFSLAVGLENSEDLINDLNQSLNKI